MSLRCLIVDDEPAGRKVIEQYVLGHPALSHVASAANPITALELLRSRPIDLLFLDIRMPGMSGLEMLRDLEHPPLVIVTTAYAEHAVDGFDLHVLDYLLKPISYARFVRGVERALRAANSRGDRNRAEANTVFVKSGSDLVRIHLDQLLYVEGADNYVLLYTKESRVVAYMTFKALAEQLPADRFMMVHKSYMVALGAIERISGTDVIVAGRKIPVSRGLRERLKERLIGPRLIKRT